MRNLILVSLLFLFPLFSFAQAKQEKRIIICAKQGLLSCLKEEIKKDKSSQFLLDKNNNTLLILAAANGHNTSLRFLADQWPKWALTNNQGRNALHMAIIGKHYDTAKLVVHLVEEDWDSDLKRFINIPDIKDLASPLHWAAYRCERDLYQFLLDYGANPKAWDKNSNTPEEILQACPPEKPTKKPKPQPAPAKPDAPAATPPVSDNKKAS